MYDYSWNALLKPGEGSYYFNSIKRCNFNPDTTGYSYTNAWWLSELSRLIYKRDRDEAGRKADGVCRNDILKQVHLEEYRFLSNNEVQCALIITTKKSLKKFGVLVFRGTKGNLTSWIANFKSKKASWPKGGFVHEGFKTIFFEMWKEIQTVLDNFDIPIFYTGHSRGGALATMLASLRPPRALYSFGSPKVGDKNFVATLNNVPVFRVVNNQDIVTTMPPSILPLKFKHAGKLYFLNTFANKWNENHLNSNILERKIIQRHVGY